MDKLILKFRNFLHDIIGSYAPAFIKRKIMTCEEMTRIMAMEQELSRTKKIWYRAHNFICICCDNYDGQFKLIKTKTKDIQNIQLSREQEQRIADSKNDVLSNILNK